MGEQLKGKHCGKMVGPGISLAKAGTGGQYPCQKGEMAGKIFQTAWK